MTPETIGVVACYGLLIAIGYVAGRWSRRRREEGRR